MPTVGLLHTSPVHVETFGALVRSLAPEWAVVTVVDEGLLEAAMHAGIGDRRLALDVERRLAELAASGAELVVCTCSTIGGLAERRAAAAGVPVVRVDRPMAEGAVRAGHRIAVVVAVESTIGPTTSLIESVAADLGSDPEVTVHLVGGAWDRFEAGDHTEYLRRIADAVESLAGDADVIVLAQASMAGAVELVDVAVPVLCSPRSAVETLLARAGP